MRQCVLASGKGVSARLAFVHKRHTGEEKISDSRGMGGCFEAVKLKSREPHFSKDYYSIKKDNIPKSKDLIGIFHLLSGEAPGPGSVTLHQLKN